MSEQEEKITVIVFDGNQSKWNEWDIKTRAIAESRGREGALDKDLSNGKEEEKKINKKAYRYLVLSLKGTPFSIVTRKKNKQNAYLSYEALKKKYEGQEMFTIIRRLHARKNEES